MARVTSKLQVTVPKAVAEQYGIHPGDDIEWLPAGESIRVRKQIAPADDRSEDVIARRLEIFDLATRRQRRRQVAASKVQMTRRSRGWRREELYDRGGAR